MFLPPILFLWSFALFTGHVIAHPEPITQIQADMDISTNDCNSTCTTFSDAEKNCNVPHCGCSVAYLRAQGNCLVCQAQTDEDAAAVQYLLDAEMTQCHTEGIPISFQVDLPPAATEIVHDFYLKSADLRRNQGAFFALQVAGGQIGLVLVLAFAVFSRKVHRDPTFLNFCITWIFSSVVFSIMLYRGTEGNTVANALGEVPMNHCLAQAAFTMGAQVMTACSTLALVIKLWLDLRAAIYGDSTHGLKCTEWTTGVLLAIPYILFIAFALPTVIVAMVDVRFGGISLENVVPTNFYCMVTELTPFLQAFYGVTLGILIITLVFDVLIIYVLYRHWWAFRHVQAKSAVSLSTLLRVMIFSIYRVVVAVAYATLLSMLSFRQLRVGTDDTFPLLFGVPIWVDMLQAAIPLVAFLVLGVNSDMIATMMFWRNNRPKNIPTLQYVATTAINSAWNEKAVPEGELRFINVPVKADVDSHSV